MHLLLREVSYARKCRMCGTYHHLVGPHDLMVVLDGPDDHVEARPVPIHGLHGGVCLDQSRS